MTASRIGKQLVRRLKVSWREQPTRHDIEAMQANIHRVGLVIKVRWALVIALAVFSLLAAWVYAVDTPVENLRQNMTVPALALVFVLLYNTYYQLTYKYLGNVAILNHAQLLFDVLVATVLVYYSGGVHSWFWAMYPLFVFEAAFILPRRLDTWLIAAAGAVCVGLVFFGEYAGVLPHVDMPFIRDSLHDNRTYVLVRYLWQVTVLGGAAAVAMLMTASIREREQALAASSIVDEKTGLYDRRYFHRALSSELARAERDGRGLYILLVDINQFNRFNKLFGIARGDEMLRVVADVIASAVRDRAPGATNICARYGGEEFAVMLTQGATSDGATEEDARAVADAIRERVESARVGDGCVTVSVGVAAYPSEAPTLEALLDAADEALNHASSEGGNRVAFASALR